MSRGRVTPIERARNSVALSAVMALTGWLLVAEMGASKHSDFESTSHHGQPVSVALTGAHMQQQELVNKADSARVLVEPQGAQTSAELLDEFALDTMPTLLSADPELEAELEGRSTFVQWIPVDAASQGRWYIGVLGER